MDFASLMSAEISKTSAPPKSTSPAPQKYLKRADLESRRQEAYLLEQATLQREREEKIAKKRKLDEEETARNQERDEKRQRLAQESRLRREEEEAKKERARRRRLGLPDLPPKGLDDKEATPLADSEEDIPDPDLTIKLRELSEPILLFAETHKQRLRRYKILTSPALPSPPTQTTGPIPTTLALVPEASMLVPRTPPPDPEGRAFLFRQLASYFTMVLTEWAVALSQRLESVKQSFQGKAALNAMVQSRENMRPLFKKFERGEVEDGILEPVVEIVRAAQERRYVDANDGYLRLSIGKAAWPIGVTMVGIHERSAREKLHESDKGQAHIMSDEVTRKFLQSIKRCLSFAQTRWPPDDQLQLMG
ncbi:mRNA splicing protein prp18 [Toensbergia leucococca]|nr:mRNA splicing protein prp18 [Toensbergia leucococca]